MCEGACGKHELAAWPRMTERKGDHSVSADTSGVEELDMIGGLEICNEEEFAYNERARVRIK